MVDVSQPHWAVGPRYSPRVLIGNWVEERQKVCNNKLLLLTCLFVCVCNYIYIYIYIYVYIYIYLYICIIFIILYYIILPKTKYFNGQ